MRTLLISAAIALSAGSAMAGGLAEPVMEAEVVEAKAASSGAGIIVPLLLLILVAAALSGGGDDGGRQVVLSGPDF